MRSTPLVSVVVLNYNGKHLLKECLDSVNRLNYRNYETIVIDNSSTDGSAEMVRNDYPWVTLEVTERIGIYMACNIGIGLAKGEIIVPFLNNDMTVDRYWLDHLVPVLRQRDVGIVDSKVYRYEGAVLSAVGNEVNWNKCMNKDIGKGELDRGQFDSPREVDYAEVMVVRRNVVERIGGFDEDYVFYWGDVDFCVRAKLAGYNTIYVPQAVVWHHESSAIGESRRKFYLSARDNIRFLIKHSPANAIVFRLYFHLISKLASLPVARRRWLYKGTKRTALFVLQIGAIFWNLRNLKDTMSSRGRIKLPILPPKSPSRRAGMTSEWKDI